METERGSVLLVHLLRTENDEIVVLSFTKFATEKGSCFAIEKAACDEIRRIADAFEKSIACECQKSKQLMKRKVLKKTVMDNLLQ